MNSESENTPTPDAPQEDPGAKFLVDFGPILVFVLLYNYLRREDPDGAIFTAATVFAVVAVLALAWSRMKLGKFSGTLVLTTVIVVVSVGLAYFFDDPRFIYMKPTVVNTLFGVGAIGGVLVGKNFAKMMLGGSFDLLDAAWKTLAIRWGLFFFFSAALNEVIWRTQSEMFWTNFKLFGFVPITFGFALSQIPFVMKHHQGEIGKP